MSSGETHWCVECCTRIWFLSDHLYTGIFKLYLDFEQRLTFEALISGLRGGGYCTDDMTYVSTVEQEYFNISWIPYPQPLSE
jgi:hypothetical protein